MYLLKKLWHPEIFQGKNKNKNYFEGWYFKFVEPDSSYALSVIPGVSYGPDLNRSHSFIQFIDSSNKNSTYIKYDISKFKYNPESFELWIDDNYFCKNSVNLNIHNDNILLSGNLTFSKVTSYPKSICSPGIMGPFTFIPFMECHHGVVNVHHYINGTLNINNKLINFTNGFGYIEKDWGNSFPKSWIWIQCNNFSQSGTSFMVSIAYIPYLGSYFIGFISFLTFNNEFYNFSTYKLSRVISINKYDNQIHIKLKSFNKYLLIIVNLNEGSALKAPVKGLMNREITESLDSDIYLKLTDKKDTIFEGWGKNCSIEIAGDIFEHFTE